MDEPRFDRQFILFSDGETFRVHYSELTHMEALTIFRSIVQTLEAGMKPFPSAQVVTEQDARQRIARVKMEAGVLPPPVLPGAHAHHPGE